MSRFAYVFAIGLVAVGCAVDGKYVLIPTDHVTTQLAGRPASQYPVPAEAPKGLVTVTSLGVIQASLRPGAKPAPALAVRFVVTNDSDTGPWHFDTAAEQLSLPGAPELQAALVSVAAAGEHPTLVIAPGQSRTIDFLYALPESLDENRDIEGCDVTWQVQTPSRSVAGNTPFQRVALGPNYPPPYYYDSPRYYHSPYYYGYGPDYYPYRGGYYGGPAIGFGFGFGRGFGHRR